MDPYLVPVHKQLARIGRPGKVASLDFPIVPSGEIEGMVYLKEGKKLRALANLNLQVLDEDGRQIAEIKSGYDGFFLMSIPTARTYQLRVDPKQLARLKLSAPIPIEFKQNTPLISGLKIVMTRK